MRIGLSIRSLFLLVALLVSGYTLLCNLTEYDGLFNSQAALNLFSSGTLVIDYLPQSYLQTHLPFQFVNGLLLTILGRSLWVLNSANVLFYLCFITLTVYIARRFQSTILLVSIAALTLSPAFLEFGFNGYGELPGLTLILAGAVCSIVATSTGGHIVSGVLLAAGMCTKWVLFLAFPPLLLLIAVLRPTRIELLTVISAAFSTGILLIAIEFLPFSELSLQQYLGLLLDQTTPTHGSNYQHSVTTYPQLLARLRDVWSEYAALSVPVVAQLKVLMLLPVSVVAAGLLLKPQETPKERRALYLFLVCFLLVYLLWGVFFNARWYARRLFNSDVLLYLCIGLIPAVLPERRRLTALIGCLLLLPLITYATYFSWKLKMCSSCSVAAIEKQLRSHHNQLPDNYTAYSYSIYEAPILEFLFNKPVRNLQRKTFLFEYAGTGHPPVLFKRQRTTDHYRNLALFTRTIHQRKLFEMQICSTDINLSASHIVGIYHPDRSYAAEIDFSSPSFARSVHSVWPRRWSSLDENKPVPADEIVAFLDNTKSHRCLEVVFNAQEEHKQRSLRLAFARSGQPIKSEHTVDYTIQTGQNRIVHNLPQLFQQGDLDLYLLIEPTLQSTAFTDNFARAAEHSLRYNFIRLTECP